MIESASSHTLGELEGHPPNLVVVVRDNNHAVASLLFSNSPSEACTIRPAMLVGAARALQAVGPGCALLYRLCTIVQAEVPILLILVLSCASGKCNFLLLWRVVPTCRESLGKVCWVALKIGGFSYNHRHTRFVHN